jgi:hypothetical protein
MLDWRRCSPSFRASNESIVGEYYKRVTEAGHHVVSDGLIDEECGVKKAGGTEVGFS